MVFLKMNLLVLLAAIAGISSAVDVSTVTDKLNLRGGLPDRKLETDFSTAYGGPGTEKIQNQLVKGPDGKEVTLQEMEQTVGAAFFAGKGYTLYAKVNDKPTLVECNRNWGPVQGKIGNGDLCWVDGNPNCEQLWKATFFEDPDGGDNVQKELPKDKQTPCFNDVIKGPKGFKIDGNPNDGAQKNALYSFQEAPKSQNNLKCELTGKGNKDTPKLGVGLDGLSASSAQWSTVIAPQNVGIEPEKTPKIFAAIMKGGNGALVHFGDSFAGKPLNSPQEQFQFGKYYDTSHVEICYDGESGKTTGDPHFKRWDGSHYEFHGAFVDVAYQQIVAHEFPHSLLHLTLNFVHQLLVCTYTGGCDVLLLRNPDFNNGQGMHIYARTKIVRWWSYIDQVVVKIGDDVFEVHGGVQEPLPYWINDKPSSVARRLLGSSTSRQKAEAACAKVDPDSFNDCVSDVLTLDDVDLAAGYVQ
ncbi:expressed unknown protein [Seminavis robusta]|uniref:Uncharacterized protein n=1 Tax=Seminavis robusta TaxID=568900 RepID=A0A9N8HRN9_9STRA|nr:expressed unknown protein [Seminavis robusta]|eukprot:Sro1420_g271110.1 n/a (469) ;mRNA; f:9243-11584